MYFCVVCYMQNMHGCQLTESVLPSSAGGTRFMYPLHCCEHQCIAVSTSALHGTPSKHRPKRILSKHVGKNVKIISVPSHLHLPNLLLQPQNWRSGDCSYSWEKGTISLKDSGSLSSPTRSFPAPHCSGLPCMPWSLLSQYDLHSALTLSFSSQALSYLCGSPTFIGSSICCYQHSASSRLQCLAGDSRTY